MREVSLKIPEVGLIAGTRLALGIGIGLALADNFNRRQRRTIARVLLMIGGFSTVPIVLNVFRKSRKGLALAA